MVSNWHILKVAPTGSSLDFNGEHLLLIANILHMQGAHSKNSALKVVNLRNKSKRPRDSPGSSLFGGEFTKSWKHTCGWTMYTQTHAKQTRTLALTQPLAENQMYNNKQFHNHTGSQISHSPQVRNLPFHPLFIQHQSEGGDGRIVCCLICIVGKQWGYNDGRNDW